MKKPQIPLQSSLKSPKSLLPTSSSEKLPIFRKHHIAKQSTIDSTNSLIHFSLTEYLRLIRFLKSSFQEDLSIISAKSSPELKGATPLFQHSKLSNIQKYKTHLILSVFPYFSTVTRPIRTLGSNKKGIIERHHLMLRSLDELIKFMTESIPPLLLNQNLDFASEKECLQFFVQIFPPGFFEYQNKECFIPKIFSSLWRYFKFSLSQELLYENLKLFLYNISIPTLLSDDFPLQRAIFEGNLPTIRRLCSRETLQLFYCNPEEQDPLGLTPLMLAIKLGRKDAVLVLTECGCNPKLRANPLLKTPIEEAISHRASVMLKYLLIAGQRLRQAQWENEKTNLLKAIEDIPDFSCEMNWECDSKFIPFAKKLAPSDTYKLYKLGSSLRVDMTLAGFSKLKCVRGNLSALFKGKGYENEGKLLIIDHEKKKIMDLLSDFDLDQLDNSAEELMKNEYMSSEFKAENVDFNPSTNWKGEIQREKISGIDTMKFIAKGGLNIQLNCKDYLESVSFKEFKDFEDYFAFAVENSLTKEFHRNTSNSTIKNICEFIEADPEYLFSLIQNQEEYNELKTILQMTSNSTKTKESSSQSIINLQEHHKKFLKEFKKSINATIWLTDNFPLQIHHLLPILEILSSISNNIGQFKEFLVNNFMKEGKLFPIKAIIPLFYTLNAVVTFQNFKFAPPKEELFHIDLECISKNPDLLDSCYRIKTEGDQNSSSNLPKSSVFQDWKAFFQNTGHEPPHSMNNLKFARPKKEDGGFFYKEDKDEKESERSLEVAKALFVNLKNDLVNVYEDITNNSNSNNSNNNNSGDFSGSKIKTGRLEIPSEKKTTQIKVFTTNNHNEALMSSQISRNEPIVPYFPRKDMKKANLTIKIEKEKPPDSLINNIANKVRESKECHNITQLNESTKNKNKKRFLFIESQNNVSLNEMKCFPKTAKNKDSQQINFNFASKQVLSTKSKAANNKHERIKSLDFNSKAPVLKIEEGDLLKKLHFQKVDIMNNEEVIFRIKEVLDSNSYGDKKQQGGLKGRKKVIDADVTYFKK